MLNINIFWNKIRKLSKNILLTILFYWIIIKFPGLLRILFTFCFDIEFCLAAHCGQCFTCDRQFDSPEHSQHVEHEVTGQQDIIEHQQEEEIDEEQVREYRMKVLFSRYLPPKWPWFNQLMQFHLSVHSITNIGEASTSQMPTGSPPSMGLHGSPASTSQITGESPSRDLYTDFLLESPVSTSQMSTGESPPSMSLQGSPVSTSQMPTGSPSKDLYPAFLLGSPVHTTSPQGEASSSQTTTGKVPGSPIHGSQPRFPQHSDEEIEMPYINYYNMETRADFKVLIHRGEGAIVNDINESIYHATYYDPNYINFDNSVLLKEILLHKKRISYKVKVRSALGVLRFFRAKHLYEELATGLEKYGRIMSLISHKKSTEKLTLLIENGTQTVENYLVHEMEKSPAKVIELVLQMALAVEQFHDFGVHLSIDHSHFFCVKISDNEPCHVKLLPATHSILQMEYNEGKIFTLTKSHGFGTYKSLEYKEKNDKGKYKVSRASDVYSLCLLAFEFTLRAEGRRLGVNNSFRHVNSEQLLGEGRTAIQYQIFTNDQAEIKTWNDLIRLFSGCLVEPQNRPTIHDVVTKLYSESTL